MKYVVGFAFDKATEECLFVEKNRPEFMVGKLNGIGGKIEESDYSAVAAMAREFQEECGIITWPEDWHKIAVIQGADHKDNHELNNNEYEIHCFVTWLPHDVFMTYSTMEDERIIPLPINTALQLDHMPNLNWLLPFARYASNDFYVTTFERKYE